MQRKQLLYGALALLGALLGGPALGAENTAAIETIPVKMTVTANVAGDKRMPVINKEDIQVKRGGDRLDVTGWVPARGTRAGLELFILIDDASEAGLGQQFDDLRAFIKDQPSSTMIGVGYMRNATVEIAQDLTSDHVRAADALRLPTGNAGVFGSPYLSLIDLMKRWPGSENRHEVVMISDGVDRRMHIRGMHRGYWMNPDVDLASTLAQKMGTNIHSVYAPGTGRYFRTFWEATNGQTNLAQLSDRTGGTAFYLGLHSAVSFQPYFAELQKALNNQYLLSFSAKPGKKAGLQPVKLSTEVAGVDIAAHDAVWVPAKE
jgi:hypothetical protein